MHIISAKIPPMKIGCSLAKKPRGKLKARAQNSDPIAAKTVNQAHKATVFFEITSGGGM